MPKHPKSTTMVMYGDITLNVAQWELLWNKWDGGATPIKAIVMLRLLLPCLSLPLAKRTIEAAAKVWKREPDHFVVKVSLHCSDCKRITARDVDGSCVICGKVKD